METIVDLDLVLFVRYCHFSSGIIIEVRKFLFSEENIVLEINLITFKTVES